MRDVIKLDHHNLAPNLGGIRFNLSIIPTGNNGYLALFRHSWRFSRLYGAWLDRDFQPTGQWRKIELPEPSWLHGYEDGRWFRLAGQLYLWCVRFTGAGTHVVYARINEQTLAVEQCYWPQIYPSNRYEKNIAMFDHGGQIHAIYSINPHCILRIKDALPGEDPQAEWAYTSKIKSEWTGGYMRGGASPVLHDGRWRCFFHGSTVQANGRRLYNCGVYEFEAEPPFRITRYTKDPVDVADPLAEPKAEKSDVIFPAGAVFVDGQWAVSYGVNDNWCEIRFYDEAEIESRMVKV